MILVVVHYDQLVDHVDLLQIRHLHLGQQPIFVLLEIQIGQMPVQVIDLIIGLVYELIYEPLLYVVQFQRFIDHVDQ